MTKLSYHDFFFVAYKVGSQNLNMRIAAKTAKQAESMTYQLEPNAEIMAIEQEMKHKNRGEI